MAVEYLNDRFRDGSLPIRVGGHSKGGNFAVYASVFCDEGVRRRIRDVFTNDGPGFANAVTRLPAYRDLALRIVSIIPENFQQYLLNNDDLHLTNLYPSLLHH